MKPFLSLIILCFLLFSCKEEAKKEQAVKWTKEESIRMNATFSGEEEDAIDSFLKRRPDWKMTKTGTGLRYFVYKKSSYTDSVQIGDAVTVSFTITLLNGQECYNSKTNGPETFIVEKTDIESGLHEGIKFLTLDDHAKLILPSHLAHGLIGDLEKIPPLETVVYDIHVLRIVPKHEN